MWLRLRQICLVARELAPIVEQIEDVLGLAVCYRDPAVRVFGLENALFPVGSQFLEVVAPIAENTAAGRYLERRGGDGGYMVITQCDAQAPRRRRIEELGIRLATDALHDGIQIMQLHPKDTGGAFFEIDCQTDDMAPDGRWTPAGPDWRAAQRLEIVTAITSAEIQSPARARLAARWSEIAEIPLREGPRGSELPLENASVRFVDATDGRPEGLAALDLAAADPDRALRAAEARGLRAGANEIRLCGMRIHLSPGAVASGQHERT